MKRITITSLFNCTIPLKIIKSGFLKGIIVSLFLLSASSVHAYDRLVIIDHNAVDQFNLLTDTEIENARDMKIMVRHASVGGNISSGLNDLYIGGSIYNRTNFVFQYRGNPAWKDKITDLVTQSATQINNHDAFTMKFCYIDHNNDNPIVWETYRDEMEALEAAYPDKVFVWWTMPIMTTGGERFDGFNGSVRAYAQANNKVLFDIAAIESHEPSGVLHTNSGYEAMYDSFSTDGGHLNEEGRMRVAKAFWVMMVELSSSSGLPNPTLSQIPTNTPVPTITPTPTPPLSKPGDTDNDGDVDISDLSTLLATFGSTGSGLNADFDGDNDVDISDLSTLLANFGS